MAKCLITGLSARFSEKDCVKRWGGRVCVGVNAGAGVGFDFGLAVKADFGLLLIVWIIRISWISKAIINIIAILL